MHGTARHAPPRITASGHTTPSLDPTDAGTRAGEVHFHPHLPEQRDAQHVSLGLGKTGMVRFTLDSRMLSYAARSVVEPGAIYVMFGDSSAQVKTVTLDMGR